jgi:uncharacterized membrane protein
LIGNNISWGFFSYNDLNTAGNGERGDMFQESIKQALRKGWAIVIAVLCVSLIGLYSQLGYVSFSAAALIVLVVVAGVVLVMAPIEYYKLKRNK